MARFGRCELRLMQGQRGLAQDAHPVLRRPCARCCARNVAADGLRAADLRRHAAGQGAVVRRVPELRVSPLPRPDLRLDLRQPARRLGRDGGRGGLLGLVRGIWQDRPVLLVHGSRKGLQAGGLLGNAASIQVLQSMEHDAWSDRDRLVDECLRWAEIARQQDPLVVCVLGATATVLAHDLTLLGIQALDIGHMASSWLKDGKQARMAA